MTRTSISIEAPAGLALAFKLIQQAGATGPSAALDAARAYPLAQRIVESLHRSDNDQARCDAFLTAVDAMYPGIRDNDDPTEVTCVDAGFAVGFATCWLLMQQMKTCA